MTKTVSPIFSTMLGSILVLSAWAAAEPSSRAGVGAIPYDGGVTFRVWAPNASSVGVSGSFNSWAPFAHLLTPEGNGYFSRDVDVAEAGDGYKFVLVNGDTVLWRNDPRAADVTNSAGHSIVVDHDAYQWESQGFSPPAWPEMVIYEMHVGTFGLQPGQSVPGNLAGVVEHLDYLEDLGINVIELMPMAEVPGDISWGYNPSYPYAVESAYGSPEDLKAFVDACHARDIAVFGDMVYNHLGPTDMDLWQFDGWSQNGMGGIYFYNDYRSYTPWGDTRPDFGRGEVRSFLRDNLRMWLDDYRFDGVRVDGCRWIRSLGATGEELPDGWSLLRWFNEDVDASTPWKLMIAEDMDSNPWLTRDVGAGGAGFDTQWDPWFIHPMRSAVVATADSDRDLDAIRNAISYRYNGQAFERVIYTESHDEVANGRSRVPEEISPGSADSWFAKKRSTLAAAVLMTSPGIPMLFQGQEFLEDGWFDDQQPLDWSRAETFSGITDLYRDLIALRTNRAGLTAGLTGPNLNIHHFNDAEKVIAWHRWDQGGPGDDVVIVANFKVQPWSNYRIGLPRGGSWKVRFNSDAAQYDPEFTDHPSWTVNAEPVPWDGLGWSAELSFGAYTSIILSQSPPCSGDLNQNDGVDVDDLLMMIAAWDSPDADLDGNGLTNVDDLLILLAAYGECP